MFININEIRNIIHIQIQAALWECCHPSFAAIVSKHENYNYKRLEN